MVQRLGLYMVRIVSEQLVTGYSHKLVTKCSLLIMHKKSQGIQNKLGTNGSERTLETQRVKKKNINNLIQFFHKSQVQYCNILLHSDDTVLFLVLEENRQHVFNLSLNGN